MLMNTEDDTTKKLEFAKLHKNAHIPGYKGHCPKIDQVVGQRFSESSKLSYLMHRNEQDSSERNDNTLLNPTTYYNYTNINFTNNNYTNNNFTNNNYTSNNYKEHSKNIINNNSNNSQGNMNLPKYNNYNRYTKDMNSGYTGHIPNQASGFGKTFTETSNMRLMEHFRNIETDKEGERNKEREMGGVNREKPQFRLQDASPQMKEYMQSRTFKDPQSLKGRQPIGGYQGHVPRKRMGEGSVGTVDEKATRKALETFQRESDSSASTQAFYLNNQPLTCHCKP